MFSVLNQTIAMIVVVSWTWGSWAKLVRFDFCRRVGESRPIAFRFSSSPGDKWVFVDFPDTSILWFGRHEYSRCCYSWRWYALCCCSWHWYALCCCGAFALSSGVLGIFCDGFLYNSVIPSRVVLPGIAVSSLTLAVSLRWRYLLRSWL